MTNNLEWLGLVALSNKVAAVILGAEAAYFLARGGTGLSAVQIAELVKTKWDYNLDIARALAAQRADTFVGLLLLIASLVMAIVDIVLEPNYARPRIAVVGLVALVFCGVVLFSAVRYSSYRARRTFDQVRTILSASGE